jgi:ELWxxDGT repeat protein
VVGNRLFFTAQDPLGMNLWSSDGTTAGTQRVWQNTLGGNFFNLRAVGRRLLFDLGSSPGPLLVSDGTAAGTTTIGIVGQNHEKVAVGNRLFFAGEPNGAGTGLELCVTDGATITLVKDVRPGSASSNPYALCAFGNGVLFVADDGVHGYELWRSDGTTAGTQLVVDLLPGPASGCPRYDGGGNAYQGFVCAPAGAARALFAGTNGASGMELWRTDGTAAGTVLHADLQPGVLGSFPSLPVRAGTQLVFAATQTEAPASPIGRELFAMPTMAVAVPVGTPCAATLAQAPLAAANGAPFLGNAAFSLTIAAVPSSIALLALGDPVEVALVPCELRVANFATPLALLTNGGGDAAQPLPIPASPAFAGLRLSAQWAVLQGGPFLGFASLSNGVDLVLQAQ